MHCTQFFDALYKFQGSINKSSGSRESSPGADHSTKAGGDSGEGDVEISDDGLDACIGKKEGSGPDDVEISDVSGLDACIGIMR
jgi:hypothetical protein